MHKPESIQTNKRNKIHEDFEIKNNQLLPTIRQELLFIYKKREFALKWIQPFKRTTD